MKADLSFFSVFSIAITKRCVFKGIVEENP